MSPTEAARIAAVLPLPKKRGPVAPLGFTRRYGNTIAARISIVTRDGLDACVYRGTTAPVNKAPPPVVNKPRPLPGEEYESTKPLPPIENAIEEPTPASVEPRGNELAPAPTVNEQAPERSPVAEPPPPPANGV